MFDPRTSFGPRRDGRTRNRRPPGIGRLGAPFDLPADEVLYPQGEPAQSLYYLESGAVTITSEGARVLERISDDMLAQMLDANPVCIRKLLHEFRRAGHLGCGEALEVHSSLAKVLLPTQLAADSG